MIYIYLTFVALTLLVAWVAYLGKVHWSVKGVMLSALVVFGLAVESHYRSVLGEPIEARPPSGFVYVHHEVQGESIVIWAWLEDRGDRLYIIPFDQDTAEELAEAQKQGTPQQGSYKTDEEGHKSDSDSGLIFDDFITEYTGETKGE